ncbi:APH(3') family aminoglycoside O-phosphotransferase [Actinokineospora iranica]|uniref:Kanamycin kinase n=1 Tax=Actinokineospora iranica TaxID=1271860 RepID=A0A1G6UA45_9PSEU|nr:APH(3') family aminoglycoside O-phosphotransferase [Actinokineospora iranica]SDD38151.1 kanamycin kinase [Actinokineospora iranica]
MSTRQTGPAGSAASVTSQAPLATGHILDGDWHRVATRSYGAAIHRVQCRGTYYVKTMSTVDRDDLRLHPENEAERLSWLAGYGFPVPEVVEVGAAEGLSWLVTTAVPGVPASGPWRPDERVRVLDAVADLTAALHSIPPAECPFDRTLAVTLPRCRVAVELGTVDLDDLDERHAGWSGQDLLAELDSLPAPREDVVVCHGDLGLDNILVDPRSLAVSGVLDAGRLGRADRWLDLAIAVRDITEELRVPATGFLKRYGVSTVDERRYFYYRLMDEFI